MSNKTASGRRPPATLRVELWFRDRPLSFHQGQALSPEGLRLEATGERIPAGTPLTLLLHTNKRVWCIPARIVSSDPGGMEIRFSEPQLELVHLQGENNDHG